jgi:nicotinate-nucleotide adenylyltransferase
MTRGPRVGVLGGTFDPIHRGHLAVARAAQRALDLTRIIFVPAARPPHRPDTPGASEYHRVEMIRRAIDATAGWEVSELELHRTGPSYTVDTLTAFHGEGVLPSQLFFLTGADAFAEIATWYRYPDVLDAAHFVVVTRPGFSVERLRARVPHLADRMCNAATVADFSTPRIVLVEADTPNVSSTAIRTRAARGASLDDCVPAAVAAYILQNHLYSPGH